MFVLNIHLFKYHLSAQLHIYEGLAIYFVTFKIGTMDGLVLKTTLNVPNK